MGSLALLPNDTMESGVDVLTYSEFLVFIGPSQKEWSLSMPVNLDGAPYRMNGTWQDNGLSRFLQYCNSL